MSAVVRTEGLTKDDGGGHGVFDLDLEVGRARSSAISARTAVVECPN